MCYYAYYVDQKDTNNIHNNFVLDIDIQVKKNKSFEKLYLLINMTNEKHKTIFHLNNIYKTNELDKFFNDLKKYFN